jgi:hypothetical protein
MTAVAAGRARSRRWPDWARWNPIASERPWSVGIEEEVVLVGAVAVPDVGFLWWDVRLRPMLGTIEVRIADAQSTIRDVCAGAGRRLRAAASRRPPPGGDARGDAGLGAGARLSRGARGGGHPRRRARIRAPARARRPLGVAALPSRLAAVYGGARSTGSRSAPVWAAERAAAGG